MDSIKEELNNYREVFKFLLLFFMAIISASVTALYKFMTQNDNIIILIFAFAGFIFTIGVFLGIRIVWKKMQFLIKEMKNG